MQTSPGSPSIFRLLVGLASVVVIVAGLKASADLLAPVLLSLFIVLVCSPIVDGLRSRRVPAWLAYTMVVFGVLIAGFILIGFLAASVTQLSAIVPEYRTLIDGQLTALEEWLASHNVRQTDILNLEFFSPTRIIQVILGLLTGLLGTLGNVGITLFIFIYMLVGASSFSKKLTRGLGLHNPMLERINLFSRSVGVYLLIKGWLGAMTALGQIVLLWVLGIDFAVLWGVLSFLFNFIPSIGYVIALVPPLLLALIKFGLVKALGVVVGYTLINNFFDVVIGPRYLGKGLDLSPLVTFLAVIFWAWILGPIGAFLALPLTVMLKKLMLETYPDSQLIAELMSADDDENAEA